MTKSGHLGFTALMRLLTPILMLFGVLLTNSEQGRSTDSGSEVISITCVLEGTSNVQSEVKIQQTIEFSPNIVVSESHSFLTEHDFSEGGHLRLALESDISSVNSKTVIDESQIYIKTTIKEGTLTASNTPVIWWIWTSSTNRNTGLTKMTGNYYFDNTIGEQITEKYSASGPCEKTKKQF